MKNEIKGVWAQKHEFYTSTIGKYLQNWKITKKSVWAQKHEFQNGTSNIQNTVPDWYITQISRVSRGETREIDGRTWVLQLRSSNKI